LSHWYEKGTQRSQLKDTIASRRSWRSSLTTPERTNWMLCLAWKVRLHVCIMLFYFDKIDFLHYVFWKILQIRLDLLESNLVTCHESRVCSIWVEIAVEKTISNRMEEEQLVWIHGCDQFIIDFKNTKKYLKLSHVPHTWV